MTGGPSQMRVQMHRIIEGLDPKLSTIEDPNLPVESVPCGLCMGSGLVSVYQWSTVRAYLDGRLGDPPDRSLLRTWDVPCRCPDGIKFVWSDPDSRPPASWHGYSPEQRYDPDRCCACPFGDVLRFLPDLESWVADRLSALTAHQLRFEPADYDQSPHPDEF